ncbi:uncharacterized protein LOC119703215 [Motacilla alba alba]|uniref:uncharacterized protein LOC119703215 n=1 Tax=Motacilla alba alba TaxID=1094192 RepID=UPI0018D52904|nr:uncharacterized protein LOC119703215 [Motacilla alba alba]
MSMDRTEEGPGRHPAVAVLHPPGASRALPAWGAQGWAVFSGLSRSPSALAALALCQMQPWSAHRSSNPAVVASKEQRRYLQPSPPGLGLLPLLSRAPCVEHSMEHPWLLALLPQLVCNFLKSIGQEESSTMGTGLRAHSELLKHQTSAALLDLLVEKGVSRPEQVPAMVRFIHQWLMANDSAEHRLDKTLLHLTEAHPHDAVMTLLRVAPSCDRYGAHQPRGLRAPQPITLYSLCHVSEQQRVPGPSGCSLSQTWHASPQACCHAPLPPLRALSPQGWAAGVLLERHRGRASDQPGSL